MGIHGVKQKVTHFCHFFNLEEASERKKYADKVSEVMSDQNATNISVKEYVKKYEHMDADGSFKEDQLWKMVEYDIVPPEEKPYTEKRTAEEDIP